MDNEKKINEPVAMTKNPLFNIGERTMHNFEKELMELINMYSLENASNTPDYVLAQYLVGCLENYNRAVKARNEWHTLGVIAEK